MFSLMNPSKHLRKKDDQFYTIFSTQSLLALMTKIEEGEPFPVHFMWSALT